MDAPTLRGRLVGHEIRSLREKAGLSREALGERVGLDVERIERLEDGVVPIRLSELSDCARALEAPEVDLVVEHAAIARLRGLECPWGPASDVVLGLLCRTAERIDVLSPLRMPELPHLDAARCTAYVGEAVAVSRADMVVRVIPRDAGAYPGVGHVMTLFRMPDGPDVVFRAHPHTAAFDEDPQETAAARHVFDLLPACW